jgi:hypothetical protein
MNRSRSLRLRRETLTELNTGELDLVRAAGGGPQPTPPIYVITHDCPTGVRITDCCPTVTC